MQKKIIFTCLFSIICLVHFAQAQDFKTFIGQFELVSSEKTWTDKDIKTLMLINEKIPQNLTSFFSNNNHNIYYPIARFESGNTVIILFTHFIKDEGYDDASKQQIHLHASNFDKNTGKPLGVNSAYIFSAGGDGKIDEKYTGKMETDGKTFLKIFNESSKKESSKKEQYKISKKGLSFEKHLD